MSLISRAFARLALRRGNCRNGLYPAANLWATIVRAQNHAMSFRHREVYRRAYELGVFVGTAGTTTVSRFRFRTGHGVTKLTYVLMIGLDDLRGPAATDPYIEIVTTQGGTPLTNRFHYGLSAVAGTDAPNEIYLTTGDVSVAASTVTTVEIKTVDRARPISICAYEQASITVSESTNYYNTMNPVAAHPIYDADRQQVVLGLSSMWKSMGGITWHWGLADGAARTRSSATYINIIDNATTGTPATSHYGCYLNPQYHNTLSATTVPFELGVYGSVSGGAGGTVRLIDTAGNTYGPVTVTGAAGWYTASINLPTAETFYTIQYAGDGANTLSVYQTSLVEYTA